MDEIKEKKCYKCGATKPLDQFYKDYRYENKRRNICTPCKRFYANEYMRGHYHNTAIGKFYRIKSNAKHKGNGFLIDKDSFIDWWGKQPQLCHYCKRPLTNGIARNHKLTDITVDRKDNDQGYTIDNIALACRRCNLMKGDWLTESQTLYIASMFFNNLN